jgi:hypothetical protein
MRWMLTGSEQDPGRLTKAGGNQHRSSSMTRTTLGSLGIPHNR